YRPEQDDLKAENVQEIVTYFLPGGTTIAPWVKRTYKLFHEALAALQRDNVIGTVRYLQAPNKNQPFDPGFDWEGKG
ncbi:MAG TPA: hypothetical protein VGW38_01055, partial [Chloroflexota bacterium]|nr:hypothetical protein [Chloroflexota bacterium]